jgi:hypothetical protein
VTAESVGLRSVPGVPVGKRAELPSISAAAASGSRRDLLVAMRDKIARDLDDGVPARELASLTRRLLEIAKDIEAIDAAEDGDDVGEAAATPDEPFTG